MKAQTQASSASVARFICTSQVLERSNAIRATIRTSPAATSSIQMKAAMRQYVSE